MAADGVQPIHVVSKFPGHRASDYPHLATDKARFVGEAVAVCLAETRAGAEDLAAQTGLSFDPLPAVVDMLEAVDKPPALVHDDWDDNVILDSRFEENVDGLANAAVSVTRTFRMNRQAVNPLEGAAVLAEWDPRDERLVVHSACGFRTSSRMHYANAGLRQNQVHVIAPDVGGGFTNAS